MYVNKRLVLQYENHLTMIKNTTTHRKSASYGVNKHYTHFAVLRCNGLIVNGWDYRGYESTDLNGDRRYYFLNDIEDMQIDPKIVKILTTKTLIRMGVDPFDFKYWNKDTKGVYTIY